jgi:DNA-binding CsgD family transcriptional regulator
MTGRLPGTAALVGRDRECARIDRLLEDAVGGESRALVIRGEAGIGKTALLEYAAGWSLGMTVLRVGGVESESDLAFAGLLGLLRPVLDRLDGLVDMQGRALAGALGLAEARAPDRFLVSAAVLGLLAVVADDGPLLCLVDDANWLDTPSAEALVFAARRLRAEPVAILFAAREGDERQFEAVGLAEVALTGVDERSAETLLSDAVAGLTPAVRSRLLTEAAGNPLALVELPRGLSDAQLDGREPLPGAIPLTPRLQQGFRRQIEQLPEPSRLAMLITAAEGTGELAILLGALAALEVPSDSLDAAKELGLIRISELRVTFRHPLVRAAVLERATLSQRQSVHAALADTLTGDEQVDRRVWHQAMATLTADDEVAAALAASAKRAELRGAHASAATAFERAAALTTDGTRKATWLAAATHAAWTAGQPDRTRDLLNRALPLAEGGQRARLLYIRGLLESRYGNLRDGVAILLDAADASDTPALTLELLLEAGYQAADAGQRDRVPELAARASDLPEPTLEARFRKTVLTGLAAMYTRGFGRAQSLLGEAIEAAAGLPDDPGDQIWAAYAAAIGTDLGAGLPFATRAVELARSQGRLGVLPAALEQQALQLYWSGQFGSAYAAAQEGYRLSLDLGRSWGWHLTLTTMAGVEAIWGRESEAREHGAAVLELAQRSGQTFVTATVRSILGLVELTTGRPEQAADILVELATDEGPQTHPTVALSVVPDAIEAIVRAGRPLELVTDALARYRDWTEQAPTAAKRSMLARCEALLALRSPDAAFGQATELAVELPLFHRARGELLYGEWLRRERRRIDARPHLRAAVDGFRALRAAPWERRAEEELRASGETARKREPSTLDQLTPRELQIAQLAAEGLSNPEIAAHLFLSPRTVEYHLRKVFTKLGLASRTDLVRDGIPLSPS